MAIVLPEKLTRQEEELAEIELTPQEIVSELDKYIIGQKDAKKAVAIALRNRYRRRKLPLDLAEPMAMIPSSGSITSPVPEMRNESSLSATIRSASNLRRALSRRHSLASSMAALGKFPLYSSNLASNREKRAKASDVAPANPAKTSPL